MQGAQLGADDVRRLALAGLVRPHPDYHGRQHHIAWEDCVYALANCERVAPDSRPQLAGTGSYVAFGRISRSQVIRVDFRLAADTSILVVTAIPY